MAFLRDRDRAGMSLGQDAGIERLEPRRLLASLAIASAAFMPLDPANAQTIATTIPATESTVGTISAVATYNNMSLYWARPGGSDQITCSITYRKTAALNWSMAQQMVWEPSLQRYSGSVVNLSAGTSYEFRLQMSNGDFRTISQSTWRDDLPIARRVVLPAGTIRNTYVIDTGGTESGYVLYEANPSGTIIDVDPTGGSETDAADYGVEIRASYVILRGLTIRNAKIHGVFLNKGTGTGLHDVVIEGNDISNWGRRNADAGKTVTVREKNFPASAAAGKTIFSTEANVTVLPNLGTHLDSGIRANGSEVARITIQGNRIHEPRYTSNNWTQASGAYFKNALHPEGPKAVVLYEPGVDVPRIGNHVVRFNDFYGNDQQAFNDILFESFGGAEDKKGTDAVADTDVYGNSFADAWDDAIEVERAVANVRVYENYFTRIYKGVSFYQDPATATVGPFYLYRNVFDKIRNPNRPPTAANPNPYYSDRYTRLTGRPGLLPSFLIGTDRLYLYHNTFLNNNDQGYQFIHGNDFSSPTYDSLIPGASNIISRNNVYQTSSIWPFGSESAPLAKTTHRVTVAPPGTLAPFDYDLHNGLIENALARGSSAIQGQPIWGSISGVSAYHLAASSPGYDAGLVIHNFNDGFAGVAPDVGAIEAGRDDFVYGPSKWKPSNAYLPAAPTDLNAAASTGKVSLTWKDRSNDESGFVIERATDALFTQDLITVSTVGAGVEAFVDQANLLAATTSFYRVRAFNPVGTSDFISTSVKTLSGNGQAILFQDDFDNGLSTTWTIAGANWSVGSYQGHAKTLQKDTTSGNVYNGDLAWDDYVVKVSAARVSGSGVMGVYARLTSINNYYTLFINNSAWTLRKRVNGTNSTLATGAISYTNGTWIDLRLTVKGSALTAEYSTDGSTYTQLAQVTDTAHSAGRIGLWGTTSAVAFDDVLVTQIVPPASVRPTGLTLAATSDTGSSATDGITRLNQGLEFIVSGTVIGAVVQVLAGTELIASQTATATTTTLYTTRPLPDGLHSVKAVQFEPGKAVSDDSLPTPIRIDTQLPPTPTALINSAEAQRSMVRSIQLSFAEQVTIAPNALWLANSSGQAVNGVSIGLSNPSGDRQNYLLNFSGSSVIGGSLPDGRYQLLTREGSITDLAGNAMTDGVVIQFHRLFGDSDGDGDVDSVDSLRFRRAQGTLPGSANWQGYFDFDQDGDIDSLDSLRFRQRQGTIYSL